MLTSTELILTFVGCYLYAAIGESRARDVTVRVSTPTDRHTHCDRDQLNL